MTQSPPPQQPSVMESFRFAWEGLSYIFHSQRNFRLQTLGAVAVILTGIGSGLHRWEWCLVFILIGLMLVTETLNTALEYWVDLATGGKYDERAKRAKDIAAAACLMMATAAAAVGLLIFAPHWGWWG